jgi:predicted ATPase/DNA-binding winged helix-turn-helix (wHTH) protein
VRLRFANCELDLARFVLRRDGEEVRLEPQAFDVLAYLVKRRGTVVRKEELLDEVWGDRFVSESALTTRIKTVRQAVDDDGNRQVVIRTVHGKGYEFIAPVEQLDEAAPPEPLTSSSPPGTAGLGAALQPLIGRETLLGSLAGALPSHRLVTLVGPGGVGKTSIGLELARRSAADFNDGVYVVELVTVVDEQATAAAFATALDVNLRRSSSIDDAIVEMLGPRRCLLVVDNCEHLVEPVATLVNRILREADEVAIVATSREPLAVPGEQVWAVEPLSTSTLDQEITVDVAMEIPAVALFVARARAADPRFALVDTTAPLVVEICRRLDGIPLAIELAAARAHAIGVAEMARRLDERFALLKAMRRGGDPRHRTMRDAIGWSYDMLESEEQELFTALCVFAGSFDLPSAEALADDLAPGDDVLDLLTRLTERSMLTVRPQAAGVTRYDLLETLRDYGRARLDDERAVRLFTTHARHFSQMAGEVEHQLRGPDEGRAIARAEASFADLRSAQRFALEAGAIDEAVTLISSIREFAMRAMRYEAFAWAEAACAVPGVLEHPSAAVLMGVRAYGAWVRGDFDLAMSLVEETRRLERELDVTPSGLAERVLANVLYTMDEGDLANAEAARQIEIAESSGVDSRVVHARYMGAVALSSAGRYDEAHELVAAAREGAERTGSPTDLASVEVATGFSSRTDAAALDAFVRADRIASAAGNRWMSAFARTEASGLLVARGEVAPGCAGLAEMVALWSRAGDWSQQWHTLSRCVIALHAIDDPQLAMELVGAIEAHATLGVAPMTSILHDVVFATREELIGLLGEDRAAELRALGAATPIEELVLRARRGLLAVS